MFSRIDKRTLFNACYYFFCIINPKDVRGYFLMQEGESMTKEQIEEEIRKIKEAHAEDEGTFIFPY